MNDIVKELVKQAYDETIRTTPSFLVTRDQVEQKFAELLINEAVNAISVQTNGFASAEESIWRTNCVHELRKHFGVTVNDN